MARRVADVLEIVVLAARAHASLRRRRALEAEILDADQSVLELHHARVGEQQRVVARGHERTRRHHAVPSFGKELEVFRSDFGRLHRSGRSRSQKRGASIHEPARDQCNALIFRGIREGSRVVSKDRASRGHRRARDRSDRTESRVARGSAPDGSTRRATSGAASPKRFARARFARSNQNSDVVVSTSSTSTSVTPRSRNSARMRNGP